MEALLQEQREQIARDLHDSVGSQLTHIISRLDLMALKNKGLESQLNDLREFTRETVQQLRETLWVLHQPEIPYGQLTDRVRGYLTRISEDLENPAIKFTAYGDTQTILPPQLATSVCRFIQEGVNNAIKHADCTDISVFIALDSDGLTIQICDNGKGFQPDTSPSGLGMISLKKRVEEYAGKLKITSSNNGTEIQAELPVSRSNTSFDVFH